MAQENSPRGAALFMAENYPSQRRDWAVSRSQEVSSIIYWLLNIAPVQSPENNLYYEYLLITDY